MRCIVVAVKQQPVPFRRTFEMKVETSTMTTIRCNIRELIHPNDEIEKREETSLSHIMSAAERAITLAFMGKHEDKYNIGQRINFEGRQERGCVHEAVEVTVIGLVLLGRFSSLESDTQATFLRYCDALFRKRGENTTILLVVDWGMMEERVIKIEKKVYLNKCFNITLSLV